MENGLVKVRVIASRYRASNRGDEAVMGFVLVYLGRAFGWKRYLDRPESVCPGVFAVDRDGVVYEATGGDDERGARRWVEAAVDASIGS